MVEEGVDGAVAAGACEAYTEFAPDGMVFGHRHTRDGAALAWRWELRHLLEVCGFAVEADTATSRDLAPAYGNEQIVVARVAA
jgi:hypothetical protein